MGECLFPACVSSCFCGPHMPAHVRVKPHYITFQRNIQYINIKLVKQRYIISYIENVT